MSNSSSCKKSFEQLIKHLEKKPNHPEQPVKDLERFNIPLEQRVKNLERITNSLERQVKHLDEMTELHNQMSIENGKIMQTLQDSISWMNETLSLIAAEMMQRTGYDPGAVQARLEQLEGSLGSTQGHYGGRGEEEHGRREREREYYSRYEMSRRGEL